MNKIATLEAQLAGDPGAIAESERKLKAAKTRIKNLQAQVMRGPAAVTKADYNAIRKALHPDKDPDAARKAELERAFKDLQAIKLNVVE